jgi:hypothetical protein
MSLAPSHDQLQLPATLETQLHDFRRRVWTIKMVEAVCVAACAVIVAFLCVFALDRLFDTPTWLRLTVFVGAVAACTIVPFYLHRWIWRQRRLEQLARLLARKLPSVGDQLLGIIELVGDETEQARSRTLCEAAIEQVAQDAQRRNLREAAPNSKHRLWSALAIGSIAAAIGLALLFPSAAANAWARLLAPWKDTPRYTFAALEAVPESLVVPHGEPFTFTVRLQDDSRWNPSQGQVQLGQQRPVQTTLKDGGYAFELPPQIATRWLRLRVGDATKSVRIEPTIRPELTSLVASVSLPKYLGLPEPFEKDVRGGSISLVKGSLAKFEATASRKLVSATVDDQPRIPKEAAISSPESVVEDSRTMEFRWEDEFGLAGKEPFRLTINGRPDEPPTLVCENLPRQRVVLDSEQLAFRVIAHDDFGVKRVGMEWEGPNQAIVENPAKGERILAAGGNDKSAMDVGGTFSATSLGIEPQPILLRIFAEDYFPDRERVYSPTYVMYVLNAEQHAIWMTEQLSKWHRQSLEVRDRELQLYEANKQIRDLPAEELDHPDTRRGIEKQAAAERANGRRLSNLTMRGEDLVKQASRNPEFGVGHLEKWAEMLQILKDISANRMPSVADLLKEASQADKLAQANPSQPGKQPPMAGEVRGQGSGSPSESPEEKKKPDSQVPQVVDVESTQQLPDDKEAPPSQKKSGQGSLGLPATTLLGGGPSDDSCPVGDKMDEAVRKQQDLLAEFERIANELNRILGNLEGSTLVKRLKAASRQQYKIAGRISDHLDDAFGRGPYAIGEPQQKVFGELAKLEDKSSYKVSLIMDDMDAYFERRRFMNFKTVLDDMKEQDVVGGLRQLGDDIPKERGLSIAQCEYWSDNLDRWAEDLVDPASGGS